VDKQTTFGAGLLILLGGSITYATISNPNYGVALAAGLTAILVVIAVLAWATGRR
jgi:hypothetical protein